MFPVDRRQFRNLSKAPCSAEVQNDLLRIGVRFSVKDDTVHCQVPRFQNVQGQQRMVNASQVVFGNNNDLRAQVCDQVHHQILPVQWNEQTACAFDDQWPGGGRWLEIIEADGNSV